MSKELQWAATPDLATSSDGTWNRLFAECLRRRALSHANEKFGPVSAAYSEAMAVEFELENQFGKGWRGKPEAQATYEPASHKVFEEEEAIAVDFYSPQTEAAVALALHPAPNLAAALFKVDLIEAEELHNYLPMPVDPWTLVTDDMARFTKGEA